MQLAVDPRAFVMIAVLRIVFVFQESNLRQDRISRKKQFTRSERTTATLVMRRSHGYRQLWYPDTSEHVGRDAACRVSAHSTGKKILPDKFTVALVQMSCGPEPADNLAKA